MTPECTCTTRIERINCNECLLSGYQALPDGRPNVSGWLIDYIQRGWHASTKATLLELKETKENNPAHYTKILTLAAKHNYTLPE